MNFQDFQKVIKEEVSLDEMDSIMDIVNYTESVKDSEFASEEELATELKEMLNSIGLDFDSEALTAMEDSVEIPLTYMDDGSAEAILSVFAQDGEGKEIDGELTLKVERLGEGKFDATILAKFGEDEAKELGDIEFELAEESEEDDEDSIVDRCPECGEEISGYGCTNPSCIESPYYDGELNESVDGLNNTVKYLKRTGWVYDEKITRDDRNHFKYYNMTPDPDLVYVYYLPTTKTYSRIHQITVFPEGWEYYNVKTQEIKKGTHPELFGFIQDRGIQLDSKKATPRFRDDMQEEITDDDDFEDEYDPIYEAKAVSVSQQRAAGAALAAKRGDVPVSKLVGASKEMYDSMSEKELRKMAKVKHSKLNEEDDEDEDRIDPKIRDGSFVVFKNTDNNMRRKQVDDEVFKVSQLDKGRGRCWVGDRDGRGWYTYISDLKLAPKQQFGPKPIKEEDDEKEKPDGMENETPDKKDATPEADETPVEETEKKYIMSEKELRAVVSWLLKNEDKIEATEEGIDGAVAEIEATFADEFEDEEGEEEPSEVPEPESDDSEMPMMEPEEDPNSPVEIYEEVRYDAAWNVILYKPHKRYFISKLFGKDEVKSKNDIENYVKKNYPDFMIFHIFDITEVF